MRPLMGLLWCAPEAVGERIGRVREAGARAALKVRWLSFECVFACALLSVWPLFAFARPLCRACAALAVLFCRMLFCRVLIPVCCRVAIPACCLVAIPACCRVASRGGGEGQASFDVAGVAAFAPPVPVPQTESIDRGRFGGREGASSASADTCAHCGSAGAMLCSGCDVTSASRASKLRRAPAQRLYFLSAAVRRHWRVRATYR